VIGATYPRRRGAELTRQLLRGLAVKTLRGLADAYAPASLADLAAAAGFTGNEVAIAAAIAMAESSGNPRSIGDNGTSFGLMQIHLPAHPEFQGWNLLDPRVNMAAAFSVYQQQGWTAWTTYKSGAYRSFLPSGLPAGPPQSAAATPDQSPAPAQPPLTIDAATGEVIPDVTPTPPRVSTGAILGLTALAAGLYLFADSL